ncbi:MAG: glycosyltransferase family 39 protein [Schleiferiaceae bacterium]|nr:glycosyltransferase family 39 protein [Schleiferiaceae bacterium]
MYFIVFVGAILRFYNYFEIPFTHDEFSALLRTRFETLSEVIALGVKASDTHPPGIQVFLWLLTRMVGETTWLLKLPFTIMGIGSIYLTFRIGKLWFNESVGLLSAAVVSFSQYTIFYSQIARPYISGFFFCLLFALSISELAFSTSDKLPKRWGFFLLISGVLAAYNHHFSLLTAFVIGLSSLFFIPRRFVQSYLLIGVGIAILYLPNLPIFMHQLGLGGVESWLAKPEARFILDFVHYVFHYSTAPLLGVVVIFLFFTKKSGIVLFGWKRKLLVGSWFVLPFSIGYLYSVYVNAVLQYSVIIFGFMGLLLLLFSFVPNQKGWRNFFGVVILLATFLPTLVENRQHYRIFYASPYEELLNDRNQLVADIPTWLHSQPHIIEDFFEKGIERFPFEWTDSLNTTEMLDALNVYSEQHDYFFLGAFSTLPPHIVPLIQGYFPTIVETKHYFNASSYLFGKGENKIEETIATTAFETGALPLWDYIETSALSDTGTYLITSQMEHALEFQLPVKLAAKHPNDFIDMIVTGKYLEGDASDFLLVSTLEEGVSFWGSTSIAHFIKADSTFRAVHTLKLSDIPIHNRYPSLKTRLWNNSGASVAIEQISIARRSGNPILYGFQGRIKKGW